MEGKCEETYGQLSETIQTPDVHKSSSWSTMVSGVADTQQIAGFDEGSLILASRNGDLDAFNQLVLHYQGMIYNLAERILGDSDAADDITQDTFLTAYLNLPRFRNGSFRSWLYRIATNACYDIHRKHKRHPVLSIEKEAIEEQKSSPVFNLSGPNLLPEAEFEKRELSRMIQHALNLLELDQRIIVTLVDLQDFDYQEAAQILGIPVGTVKSRLARARLRLRQLLDSIELFPKAPLSGKPITTNIMS